MHTTRRTTAALLIALALASLAAASPGLRDHAEGHEGPDALVMHVNWPSQAGPFEEGEIDAAMEEVASFLHETSYESFDLAWTIVQITMPAPRCSYVESCGLPGETPDNGLAMRDALIAAAAGGVEPEKYEFHVLLSDLRKEYPPQGEPYLTGGNGLPSGKVFASDLSFKLLGHEFVHSMNVAHSNLLSHVEEPPPPLPTVLCPWPSTGIAEFAYGNLYDVMGSASVFGTDCHVNVRTKSYLGWLPDTRIQNVTAPTYVYQLHPQDEAQLPPVGQTVALRIERDASTDYWVEFRQRIQGGTPSCKTTVDEGVLVYLADKGWRYMGLFEEPFSTADKFDPALLLDMDWEDEGCDEAFDAALLEDKEYCDANGVSIELLNIVEATPSEPAKAEVWVQVPPGWSSAANRPSSIEFIEPPTSVHCYVDPGEVTFYARVLDPEGFTGVRFELYSSGSEFPSATVAGVPVSATGPTESLWRGKLDLSGLPDGGYVVVATVEDGEGRSVSNGTFFGLMR